MVNVLNGNILLKIKVKVVIVVLYGINVYFFCFLYS